MGDYDGDHKPEVKPNVETVQLTLKDQVSMFKHDIPNERESRKGEKEAFARLFLKTGLFLFFQLVTSTCQPVLLSFV